MNKENLLRMANHIETIPQEDFNMYSFRKVGSSMGIECNSVGCAIGHCTILDIENIQNNFIDGEYDMIEFTDWSKDFTGVTNMGWNYLFSSKWRVVDNTPKGTANRIRHVVKHGFPNYIDMKQELNGHKKLSYE